MQAKQENTQQESWRLGGAEAVMAEQCQARGPHAAVAAAAPLAALIGTEMLRAGGNAYDAAVAAALAETVLLPPKCGLAGDLVALVWHKDRKDPETLLAIGGAPRGLRAVAERGELERTGPTSVGVPAAPAGYLALAERGRLPLAQLAQPSIDLAREGFCWSRICSALAQESAELVARHNPSGCCYYPEGKEIRPGTITRLPGLARALEALVADGPEFLAGEVGEAILRCVREHGGILEQDDFAFATAEWTACQAGRLGDMPLYVTPAPTHGASLIHAVQEVTPSTEYAAAAVYAGVMKAIAWQRRELADPSGTSMVSAVDQDGTMVTIVHSNSYPRFGSGLIVHDYDLILSNRAGRGYSSDPAHPNFPVAGRRPATTLHAWAVQKKDQTRLLGATPGGANQMPWNAQTLARLLTGQEDIGRLIVAPRWEWIPADDSLVVEDGFTAGEMALLRSQASRLEEVELWATSSAMQIIAADGDGLCVSAAADPRTVGSVMAF
ncbi:gamma-glutamyltransferase [Luteithermobacter gelatinilyticus]|uniref:gamma-glutamyltransferase n=1 Tax=Luteithermobacter gelatinilyticus TaxID=2582913 RepID=UPI0011062D3B|nr:gamma-glutamyltransferase [Luteithermobacter gelatinilyticus]